jgi:colicin import membrane protein
MMAEIQAEMARQAALDAFQANLAADKAAAAKSTAAYQSKLAKEAKVIALIELANQMEIDAFEASLAAELAATELASEEMMAEIEDEMARQAALEIFQQKIADEKAAAAASTAAYQAKNAYDVRVTKIMDDLIVQLDELGIADSYKSVIADELINEATEKLEDEKFIGAISGEIVTVAIHDFCKVNLGLSDSNIELFRKALAGNYLGNVGPQVTHGTEFTSGRWDEYIECVGSKRK